MNNLLSELRRRNIFRVAGVYAVVGWLLMQFASILESSIGLPDWFDGMVVALLLIGFPIALVLAWAFEMTPEGVKRTEAVADGESIAAKTGRGLDYVLIGGLALVGVLIVGDRMVPEKSNDSTAITSIADAGDFAGQSIAVLPFEDFSPDKDQAYFADGIAEELLNVLARVDGLRVASRTSAFSFKEREHSISEIATALNVGHILEGSVRKAGDTLRITAQLIDTKTDEHLWSETYDRPLTAENIFQIQDEISKAIVLELNGRLDLLPETDDRLTHSTQALEAYLKGKESYGSRNVSDIEVGITELIRAVTIDPEFAVAHAKLARAYTLEEAYGEAGNLNAHPRARIHIERAQALAPDDWEVLSEYAWVLESIRMNVVGNDVTVDQVIAAFDAAIAANPNNAEALRIAPESLPNRTDVGRAYQSLGDVETAHRIFQSCRMERSCISSLQFLHIQLGMEVDGLGSLDDYSLFLKHYVAGEFDMLAQLVTASSEAPLTLKVSTLASLGHWDEAYDLIQANPSVFEPLLKGASSDSVGATSNEIALLATLAHQVDPKVDDFRALLSKTYEAVTPDGHSNLEIYSNGAAWAMLEDDPDGAMVWLNALADQGKSTLIFQDALLEPLKPRADYQAFLKRMDGYRARDRALIEAQLANPPEVWWSLDELEEK